jgi:hypothetical protein
MIGHMITAPRRRQRAIERQAPSQYRARDILAAYAVAVMINLVVLTLMAPLLLLSYPVTGVCLSRYIGRRIVWWPFAANVQNVAAIKMHIVWTWPLTVPTFAWQLLIVRYL